MIDTFNTNIRGPNMPNDEKDIDTTEHDTETESEEGESEMTIDEEAAALWTEKLGHGFEFYRGEVECMHACSVAPCTVDCPGCSGTGRHLVGDDVHALGRGAAYAIDEMSNGLHDLAAWVARARVVDEKAAKGEPWADKLVPEARPMLDELEAMGPVVARAIVLLDRLSAVCHEAEHDDPREVAYQAKRAELLAHVAQRDGAEADAE